VDEGETATQTVVRECAEEIGVVVHVENVEFAHLSHSFSQERVYYDIYFAVKHFDGTPRIMEPDKCSELAWFALDALPEDIIEFRRLDVDNYTNGIFYSERIEKD
jgi:ADP-ribose pyrophosphatase